MVFYDLTLARIGRYIKPNSCPVQSSHGRFLNERSAGGIRLVNLTNESCRPSQGSNSRPFVRT